MKCWKFNGLLTSNGWLAPAWVQTDDQGKILHLSSDPPNSLTAFEHVSGYAIPGFQNAHSHAFQYAMAGLAEIHPKSASSDDFWSWRETMYKIALSIDPEEMEAIATMVYAEMTRHGYTQVAEFHYLHNGKDGSFYSNRGEMIERLVSAAESAGIRITILPMFYQMGGFGKKPESHQRRFISKNLTEYQGLLDSADKIVSKSPLANLGWGIHSLRAVDSESIIESFNNLPSDVPVHIHISEQLKEVAECENHWGARPVQWLADNIGLGPNLNLVHATHLDEKEVKSIAESEARVVLCPSTEGNLGDGIFPLRSYQKQGGQWTIGTDSHIGLSPLEELRILDYGQRLISHNRNIFTTIHSGDSGKNSLRQAIVNGRRSMGVFEDDFFKKGQKFDAAVLDSDFPLFSTSSIDNIPSTAIYAADPTAFLGTIINGKWVVKNQKHQNSRRILEGFQKAMKKLRIR